MKFIKYINDPIYGGIPITAIELQLIDTPIFQRLRNISQLGKVNYVFPGAEHSRFVHSLGVLYIMGEMVNHLLTTCNKGLFSKEEAQKMRIAALLHDIGHYPLSHLGEVAYSWIKHNEKSNSSSSAFTTSKLVQADEFKPHQFASFHRKDAHHENLGALIINKNPTIRKILKDNKFDPYEIGCIIQGKTADDDGNEFIAPVLCQLLHSSFDADRLDYLLRDSHLSGNLYGLVDFRYLIRCLLIRESDGKRYLFFNRKAQHVSEHFLMSRYFHYAQVIHHKTNAAFEGIIKYLYIDMLHHNQKNKQIDFEFPTSMEEILKWAESEEEQFCKFDDNLLFAALENYNNKTDNNHYREIYNFYKNNTRPKVVFEKKLIQEFNNENVECAAITRVLAHKTNEITEILGTSHWGYQILPIAIEGAIHKRDTSDDDLRTPYNKKVLLEAIKLLDVKHRRKKDVTYTYLTLDDSSIIAPIAKTITSFVRIYIYDTRLLKNLNSSRISQIHKSIEDLIKSETTNRSLPLNNQHL